MLLRIDSPWFKACAAVTAALTSWFSAGALVHSHVAADARLAAVRREGAARNLGLDPKTLTGAAKDAKEAAEAARRRADALSRLRQRTSPDPERQRRAESTRRAVEAASRPALLAGLARTSEDAGTVAQAERERPRGRAAAARLEADRRTIARALEGVGGDVALAAPLERVRRLEATLRTVAVGGRVEPGRAAEVERLAPSGRGSLRPARASPHDPASAPPEPRRSVRFGQAPSPSQQALYAALLDAPGLEVETPLGGADPLKLAAGIARWAPTLAMGMGDATSGLLALYATALPPPIEADLQETPEARTNPEIRALAERLGNDPLAIYNFVHDETDAEPYYGAKKGARGALAELAGNDADLSALLVSLLRVAGVPARYEYGTVDLTPEQAQAWSGTTNVLQAADVLRTGGIPATVVLVDGRPKSVRVEHVWVRAWVPYGNYRGKDRAGSQKIWVRLDPTLKRASIVKAFDARGSVTFDSSAFLAASVSSMPLDFFEGKLRNWVASAGLACKSLDDLVPSRRRVADRLSLLPAELPATVLASLATFTGFPSALRHSASVTVGERSFSLDLPGLYGASISLRYRGATPADEQAIRDAGGITALARPYQVRLVPVLSIDGVAQGAGAALLPGEPHVAAVAVTSPNAGSQVERHNLRAGGVYAMAFAVGVVPDALVASRESAYQRQIATGAGGDDLEAARVELALWRYFWNLHRDVKRALGLQWFQSIVGVSEGMAGAQVDGDLLYGVPVTIRRGKWVIDVPRGGWTPYSVDGKDGQLVAASTLAQWQGSAWEHRVWEQVFGSPAVSTVRVFQAARSQGVNLLRIDKSNVGLVGGLPYSQAARTDVIDGVHAGKVATIPERPITWGDYAQQEAWTLQDPVTGAAAFRIGGAASGGASNGSGPGGGGPRPCPCGDSPKPAHSTVSLSVGNMYFSETDLSVPARGIPVSFARRYDSMSLHGGRLGPGWQHTWEVRLIGQPNGDVLYVNDDFRGQRFVRNGDGSFTPEPGYHEVLSALADGWALTLKDGTEYRFRADGQLRSIQTLNDHVVQLRYDSASRLEAVLDATMRRALSFAYDAGGLLESVTALDGRRVAFAHDSGDLVAVTDVLGGRQEYGYDGEHRLSWKKDRLGNLVYEFYDGAGRWIGGQDPDGLGRRVAYDVFNRRAVHVDKRGSSTIYEYNERGNPTAVTDALGNRRTMEWNASQEKVAEVDARGNRTSMTYDAAGNLLSRTDPLGATSSYTYDARGRVLTAKDAAGKVTTNTYDGRGNLTSSTDPAGATTEYGYTGDGLPQTITQPGGAVTTLTYRADGTVGSIQDPGGGATVLGYDAFGHLATITDALGNVRRMESDAAGRIQWMEDATQARTVFTYDAEGNRTAVKDVAGSTTGFAYDALHRLVAVTDSAGKVNRTEYDPEGNVTARVDALGRRTVLRYDAAGRLAETVDPAGNVTTQGYCADVGSQPCAVVDPLGNLTAVELDALGRPVATVAPNGARSEEHYDVGGRRDWSRDAAGRVTGFSYDEAGRLVMVTDPLGGKTQYGYDERGNRTRVTDANDHVTAFAYDLANRLISETNPIGNVTSYEYDAAGNRRFKTDGNGKRTEYFYDANRRLKEVRFADGTSYEYDYDARGNRVLEQSPAHRRELAYDALGRLQRVVDGGVGRTITYGYDALGNRTSMALDTGERVQYRWDAMGRLSEVQDPQGDVTRYRYDAAGRRSRVEYGNRTAAEYAYDAVGQVLSIVYANQAGEVLSGFGYGYDTTGNRTHKAFAEGGRERYGYDALDRLTAVDYPAGRHVEYGYDAVGNRTSLLDTTKAPMTRWAASAVASTQYAATGKGSASAVVGAPDVAACSGGVTANHWASAFDSNTVAREEWLELTYAQAERARGIRIHETLKGGFVMRVDLIEESGTAHTVYTGGDTTECGGWLGIVVPLTAYKVKKVKVFTRALNVEGIDAVGMDVQTSDTYQYNGFNQLLSVTGPSGSTSFGYDGNGNQVAKSDGSGTTSYSYSYDNRLLGIAAPGGVTSSFEYDANGLRTKRTDSSGTRSYLLDGLSIVAEYAPGATKLAWYTQSLARIDEVLNVVNGTGKFWYESDALGSTYALADSSGGVVSRASYDVFGERSLAAGVETGQPFGFTGREHDGSGLVYARARYLSPSTGRWNRPDPLGMADGPNRYLYVSNSPTRQTDPTGLFEADVHNAVTAEAFAGVLTGIDFALVVEVATHDADALNNQFDDYRHGMRAQGTSLDQGIRRWVEFVDGEMAYGVAWGNSRCAELHQSGLRELGYGVHAVEDYFSPPHHMQVMDWSRDGFARHKAGEDGLRPESGPAREAYRAAREYAYLYQWLHILPMSADRATLAGMAWGYFGQFLSIDASTAP